MTASESGPGEQPGAKARQLPMHGQMAIALVLAFAVGLLVSKDLAFAGVSLYSILQFGGDVFLRALQMVVVPLVVSSIICGVYGLGTGQRLARLGGLTMGIFFLSTLLAILLGLTLVNLTQPGLIAGQPAHAELNLSSPEEVSAALGKVGDKDAGDIAAVFLRMIPTNIVAAAGDSQQLLGVIVFALLFGFFMRHIAAGPQAALAGFWQGVQEVMMLMTLWIMKAAPLGVFCLVAKTLMGAGIGSLLPLLLFFVTVLAGLVLHLFVTLGLFLRLSGLSPLAHLHAMVPALLTAFSTASSSASLPVTLRCLHDRANVSAQTTSFVAPLGATINMNGTALYECVAALFIAQAYGLELSFAQQFLVVLLALVTSIGVAGIPAASLVAIAIILGAIGLPLEGIGLLLVTDRLLDMCRTAVNIYSDSCCAAIVDKHKLDPS